MKHQRSFSQLAITRRMRELFMTVRARLASCRWKPTSVAFWGFSWRGPLNDSSFAQTSWTMLARRSYLRSKNLNAFPTIFVFLWPRRRSVVTKYSSLSPNLSSQLVFLLAFDKSCPCNLFLLLDISSFTEIFFQSYLFEWFFMFLVSSWEFLSFFFHLILIRVYTFANALNLTFAGHFYIPQTIHRFLFYHTPRRH